jgi:hypothetical protein
MASSTAQTDVIDETTARVDLERFPAHYAAARGSSRTPLAATAG